MELLLLRRRQGLLARQLGLADILITYELDAQVPRPYFDPGYYEPLDPRRLKAVKPKAVVAVKLKRNGESEDGFRLVNVSAR